MVAVKTTQTLTQTDRPAPGAHRAERPNAALRALQWRRAIARWVCGPAPTTATTTPATSGPVLPVAALQEEAA